MKEDGLQFGETGPSLEAHADVDWGPEWVIERFAGLLVCQNTSCGELAAIGGHTRYMPGRSWDEQNWVRELWPDFLTPGPPVFPIPAECPEAVADELRKAFDLYWSDRASSANRLRVAVESLLTDRKIKRYTVQNNKRQYLSLHKRIMDFEQSQLEPAKQLLAIKWLGNTGSHAGLHDLGPKDVLEAFELFENVLELVYMKRQDRLMKIAKRVTKRKGRPQKSARSH